MPRDSIQKSSSYDAGRTQEAKRAAISAVLSAQAALSQKAPERTDLHDLAAVKDTVERYVSACAEAGIVPNVEGAAAALGVSRRRLYQVWDERPEDPVAVYLDKKRLEWASVRIALAERGAIDPTTAIFVTLNSGLGYSNRHDVLIEAPQTPFEQTDTAAARRRILEALPEWDGDD